MKVTLITRKQGSGKNKKAYEHGGFSSETFTHIKL